MQSCLKIFLTLLIFAIPAGSCLADSAEIDRMAESELSADLESSDFSTLNALRKLETSADDKKWSKIEEERIKISPFRSKSYYAILKKGSRIFHIKTRTITKTTRKLYVEAQSKTKQGIMAYLVNKSGEIEHETEKINLVPIMDDINLHPKPETFKGYKPQERIILTDTKIKLSSSFTFQNEEVGNTSYFRQQEVSQAENNDSSATHLMFKTFYNWDIPFSFGLNFSMQNGVASDTKWNATFWGASMRYMLGDFPSISWPITISLQRSLSFEAATQSLPQTFEATALQIDLEGQLKTKIGKLIFGMLYRVQRLAQSTISDSMPEKADRNKITSFGIILGYGFDITL